MSSPIRANLFLVQTYSSIVSKFNQVGGKSAFISKLAVQRLKQIVSSANGHILTKIVNGASKKAQTQSNYLEKVWSKTYPSASTPQNNFSVKERPIFAANQIIKSFTKSDMESVGLFRIAPTNDFIKSSKISISKGIFPLTDGMTPPQKAGLLKSLLIDNPLFEKLAIDRLFEIDYPQDSKNLDDPKVIFPYLSLVSIISVMPQEKKALLRDLLQLCDNIDENSENNKMNLSNLALMFGPILLPADSNSIVDSLTNIGVQQRFANFLMNLDQENKEALFL